MTTPPPTPSSGWYPDPDGGDLRRYWDGSEWGPTEPAKPKVPRPSPPPTPAPESIGAVLNEAKREIKKEYEAEKEAASGKATLITGAIFFVVFVGGTWFTDMSVLAKIGMSLFWIVGIIYSMAKIAMKEDEEKNGKA